MKVIFNVGIFMSPMYEMKDCQVKCIFYRSPPQETGGLKPMTYVTQSS